MCDPSADVIGQPQGPTTTVGPTDGSCAELPPPTEGKPDSAPPRESTDPHDTNADATQTTPMGGAARCDLFFLRLIRILVFARPSNFLLSRPASPACSHRGRLYA